MGSSAVVLMTDHGSGEGSRVPLEKAVELVTGVPPLSIDARHFMAGGRGRVGSGRTGLWMEVASEEFFVIPDVLIMYEIPPADRWQLVAFQRRLSSEGVLSFGTDPDAWCNATDKRRTVDCFRHAGIAQMETIALCRPDWDTALDAFDRLGGDVWARPTTGAGGKDVFHLTTRTHLRAALGHYAASGQDWLLSRDAHNVNKDGRRHQFRVIVLQEQILRVCEHVQADTDAPCNESRGAVSRLIPADDLPLKYRRLAVAATRSLGLPFGGVDLATEHGGVVFEVNVHPTLDVPRGLETVAIPFVQAHLR